MKKETGKSFANHLTVIAYLLLVIVQDCVAQILARLTNTSSVFSSHRFSFYSSLLFGDEVVMPVILMTSSH